VRVEQVEMEIGTFTEALPAPVDHVCRRIHAVYFADFAREEGFKVARSAANVQNNIAWTKTDEFSGALMETDGGNFHQRVEFGLRVPELNPP
jgi:hypothetical protein